MHVAARIGIAAGVAGAVGFGAYKLNEFTAERTEQRHAKLDDAVAKESATWSEWKTALDTEFPGGRLDTPADHARLDAFLREHPAPSYIDVQHADFTSIRLRRDGDIVDRGLLPMAEQEKAIGYGAIGVLGMLAMGGAALVSGLKGGGATPLATVGKLVGGGAAVAASAGAAALVVGQLMRGDNTEGYYDLVKRIHAAQP
jgi:hypothetical protein